MWHFRPCPVECGACSSYNHVTTRPLAVAGKLRVVLAIKPVYPDSNHIVKERLLYKLFQKVERVGQQVAVWDLEQALLLDNKSLLPSLLNANEQQSSSSATADMPKQKNEFRLTTPNMNAVKLNRSWRNHGRIVLNTLHFFFLAALCRQRRRSSCPLAKLLVMHTSPIKPEDCSKT